MKKLAENSKDQKGELFISYLYNRSMIKIKKSNRNLNKTILNEAVQMDLFA